MVGNHALAFIGDTLSPKGEKVPELFIVELPQDEAGWKVAGDAPLSGTETTLPAPPRGVVQRRLTFTHHRIYPARLTFRATGCVVILKEHKLRFNA